MDDTAKTQLQPTRTRVPTQHLADLPIGVPGQRRRLTGVLFARYIYHMVRYLCLQRVSPEFDGQIELVEIRLSIPALALHITTLGTMQPHQGTDAWYVRVTQPDENKLWADWPTTLLDCEPHTDFPLEMEVPGPPIFHDGDWLDYLWRWFQYQFAAQKAHFDALIAQSVASQAPQVTDGRTVVTLATSIRASEEQNPAALHEQMQVLLTEMQQMAYADLHPMEAAILSLMEDAAAAKQKRKAVQKQIVDLHALAVPAFAAAIQGVLTSDDEQWGKTSHWILDLHGMPAALGDGEVTRVMQQASDTALKHFRDDLPAAKSAEQYALLSARKVCGMAPGGHVFLAKDSLPRLCKRCGLPWQEGQTLLQERPRVHSGQVNIALETRTSPSSAFLKS